MLANGGWDLTLILLTWTKWRAPTDASKWRMGFNSAFKGLNESADVTGDVECRVAIATTEWLVCVCGHQLELLIGRVQSKNKSYLYGCYDVEGRKRKYSSIHSQGRHYNEVR